MISPEDLTAIGIVNKTHGIKGEMSVTIYDDRVRGIIDTGFCVVFVLDGLFVPFFVDSARPRGNESLLVCFDGQDSREACSVFVGLEMYAMTSALESMGVSAEDGDAGDEEGFYAEDLIGFRAFDGDREIGVVDDVDDSTDNPLFIISRTSGQGSVFVPVADELISEVNESGRVIVFNLPEGLVDLNS